MSETKSSRKRKLWDLKIVRGALLDSLIKLNPATMMRNPVMFVVEVGSVVTTFSIGARCRCRKAGIRF
jgi:high-affinity K+ transport system ATPase subunit B